MLFRSRRTPTRTQLSDSSVRYWALMRGSTLTTCSTRTARLSTLVRFGMLSTGRRLRRGSSRLRTSFTAANVCIKIDCIANEDDPCCSCPIRLRRPFPHRNFSLQPQRCLHIIIPSNDVGTCEHHSGSLTRQHRHSTGACKALTCFRSATNQADIHDENVPLPCSA